MKKIKYTKLWKTNSLNKPFWNERGLVAFKLDNGETIFVSTVSQDTLQDEGILYIKCGDESASK